MIENPAATARLYREAADVIREGGLAKKDFGPYDKRNIAHCTVGAMSAVLQIEDMGTNGVYSISPEIRFLAELLGIDRYQHMPKEAVYLWNDRDETTAADVITLFEQAAEKLEAEL